ncbi:hypothetical protein [Fibrobacter sp.]|uniref:hypothetical protein n=1 Tax=Fibrobacter sp. TaxID=35828 RepID=UPI00388E164A
MRNALLFVLCVACLCCAQLAVQKKSGNADSVKVKFSPPAVLVENRKSTAMDDALDNVGGKANNDSLVGTLVGIGAEFVGEVMRDMLSPETPEAHARELECKRQQ